MFFNVGAPEQQAEAEIHIHFVSKVFRKGFLMLYHIVIILLEVCICGTRLMRRRQ